METTRITYHVRNRDGRHDFASRMKALSFARALSQFGWIGDLTVLFEQPRDDSGLPTGEPIILWSKVRIS
jgi:hypothetical protein